MTPLSLFPGFFRVDDRNFRSHYYEKVGFRGMDERKTLEIILKDDPISLEKCVNFTLRCTIPAADRYIFIIIAASVEVQFYTGLFQRTSL